MAIEIDPALAQALRDRYPNVEVLQADVLETNLGQWGPAVIAGNLPYYITSPILDRIFAAGDAWKRAVLLVQLEVAERLNARHGTRNYGFLTVKTRLFASIEQLFHVPADAFSPPPKVESAAISLTPVRPPISDMNGFLKFAARSFRQKRKTLRNNLEPFYGPRVSAWPEARLRAEQIPFEGFLEMYGRLRAESP